MTLNMKKAAQGRKNNFVGVSTESLVRGQFQLWEWSSNKPEPDEGVDLVVQTTAPDSAPGAVIAAQIKSMRAKKASVTLEHAAACRLRDQPLPAFLFAYDRHANQIYWVYLEPLFRTNQQFLKGNPLRVQLDEASRFAHLAQTCPEKLWDALNEAKARGALKLAPRLSGHASELETYYAEVDPRLRVKATLTERGERYAIYAKDEPVPLTFHIKTSKPTGVRIRDLFEWGGSLDLPGSLTMEGSRVVEDIFGPGAVGQLTILASPIWTGRGIVNIGSEQALLLSVSHHQGKAGAEWIFATDGDLLVCRCRFTFGMVNDEPMTANITIDFDKILAGSADDLYKLRGISALLHSREKGLSPQLMLLQHPTIRRSITLPSQSIADAAFRSHLRTIEALESLSWVADFCSIKLDREPLGDLEFEEIESWLAASALVRGERLALDRATARFEFDLSADELAVKFHSGWALVLQTAWLVRLRGRVIAEIPIRMDFINYDFNIDSTEQGSAAIARPRGDSSARYMSIWSDSPPLSAALQTD